nr:MAG TPA: hypothetical protein [Caudoviricetes sp.]
MANNVFVKIPERGDACVGRLSDKKLFYIKADTLVTSELDKSVWEVQGVVSHREGKRVTVVGLNNSGNIAFCDRVWYYLSGYTLDGAEHSIVLAIPTKANWNKNVEKTITYTASTVEEFISALNAAFEADADFTDQDWYADLTADGRVRVHYVFATWQQYDFTAKSGITKTNSLPEFKQFQRLRRKSGQATEVGGICSWHRALSYYRNDNGDKQEQGGRTTEQTSIKQAWPINLPTWNGTSTKNPGDFCKALRDVYGEGEDGWRRFMRSCMSVTDTDYGIMMYDGRERGKLLSSFTYTSRKVVNPKYMCPASGWCASFSTSCLPAGSWHLPAPKELVELMRDITQGTGTPDVLNRTIVAAGGKAISNGSNRWACARYSPDGAWDCGGTNGCWHITAMYDPWLVASPLSLHILEN